MPVALTIGDHRSDSDFIYCAKADDPTPVADARAAMLRDTEDEYRRLLYVAMTRAKDDLDLVLSFEREITTGICAFLTR